jgi:hypothetical protein
MAASMCRLRRLQAAESDTRATGAHRVRMHCGPPRGLITWIPAAARRHVLNPLDVVRELLRKNSDIVAISTRRVHQAPLFQERLPNGVGTNVISKALEIRKSTGLSFMDGLNLALIQLGVDDEAIVANIAFQNANEERTWTPSEAILSNGFDRTPSDSPLAMHVLSSAVRLSDGSIKHLALMDFHIPASPVAQRLVRNVCRHLGRGGWLLESGRSYHYYDESILSVQNMYSFLGRGLMFAPITDRGWIAHQIVDGECCLRTSSHPSKIGTPVVVAKL